MLNAAIWSLVFIPNGIASSDIMNIPIELATLLLFADLSVLFDWEFTYFLF